MSPQNETPQGGNLEGLTTDFNSDEKISQNQQVCNSISPGFYNQLLPSKGLLCLAIPNPKGQGFKHKFYSDIAGLMEAMHAHDEAGMTVYFAQASFNTSENRKGTNVCAVRSIWMDIDCGKGKPYATQREAAEDLIRFCTEVGLPMPTVVNSGNGLYAHWALTYDIMPDQWKGTTEILKRVTVAHNFHDDPMRTADIASVLRPAGSHNRKDPNEPKRVVHGTIQPPVDFITFAAIIAEAAKKKKLAHNALLPPKKQDINAEFLTGMDNGPPSSGAIVADHCGQLRMMKDTLGDIPEPLWYACIGVLRHCSEGEELIQTWSAGHPDYDPEETTKKIAQHVLPPTTCAYFGGINSSGCIGCKHASKVKSPIVLGRAKQKLDDSTDRNLKSKMLDSVLELTEDMVFFHDEHNQAYVFFNGRCTKINSSQFKQLLSYMVHKQTGKAASSEVLKQAIGILEGRAIHEGSLHVLENRVARHGGAICYDMGNGSAVFVEAGFWKEGAAPILFQRHMHQQVQVSPCKGGDPWQIFDYLNVATEHMLLILVTLISYFIPFIPHPILHPHGPQGSCKSSLFKALKLLVDPSSVEILMCSNDRQKVIHVLFTHYMPLFDNLSGLSGEIADLLCQACTGAGIEQRQLYTDDESIIHQIHRCIGINGINIATVRPDLLDRTLLIQMERVASNLRREEGELWAAFEGARPYILGGIFDTLAQAMQIYPTVKLTGLPRLADFGRWGYAIAEALEQGKGAQFIRDYEANMKRQSDEIIQGNTLATALFNVMKNQLIWNTTVGLAFEQLKASAQYPGKDDATFPKAARKLRDHLERLKPTLADSGISYTIGTKTADGFPITFRRAV